MSTINLLPNDYPQQRRRRRGNLLALVLFAVVIVGIGGAYVVTERSRQRTVQVGKQVDAAYADAVRLIEQMQQLETQKTRLLRKAKQTAGLQERVPRSYLLAVLTNACPQYTSLVNVRLQFKRVERAKTKGTGAGGPGGASKFQALSQTRSSAPPSSVLELTVTGLASTDVEVGKFIANLARNPLLTSPDLVYTKEKLVNKEVPCREFQITLQLRHDVDVLDVLQEARKARQGGPKSVMHGIPGAKG